MNTYWFVMIAKFTIVEFKRPNVYAKFYSPTNSSESPIKYEFD